MSNLMASLEQYVPNKELPELRAGDTVRVHALIVEGEKERVQVFQGMVIRVRRGGINSSFTVRRIAAHGVGVERTFLLASPRRRQGRGAPARQGAPRSPLLHARTYRQGRPPEGTRVLT